MQQRTKNDGSPLVVAAIDFGTTYSGWAFSFRHEFESDPLKVSAKNWIGGQLVSLKGPTCVLIKPDGQTLYAFGYDAESKYADLAETQEHKSWYLFKRFKMSLFSNEGVQRSLTIDDETDKKLPALTVFSLSIKYLVDDLIKTSRTRISGDGVDPGDIKWVLTVPAIWNDAAKQFMREAAEKAGIKSSNLTIALEPEAASLYCRHLPVQKADDESCMAKFKPGTKYMVLDAGGGTVDITVHEVMGDKNLKELHKASGGAWGGTRVDEAFKQFLIKLVGAPVMRKFKNNHMEDYIEMFRDFEIKKRSIGPKVSGKITMRIPTILTDMFKEETEETLREVIPQTNFANKITLSGDKLRMEVDVMRGFFVEPIESILDHVETLLKEPTVKGCAAIIMVGGFSESVMLQESVKRKFTSKGIKIIIPDEAGLAVLKGAVIYGHCPKTIAERVSKFTYGVKCRNPFDPKKHPASKKDVDEDGNEHCRDIFSTHVTVGQHLKIDEEHTEEYTVARDDQKSVDIVFYCSSAENPKFTDETGCRILGSMHVDVPGRGKDRAIEVSMKFGRTEIEASARIVSTGKVTTSKLNFLD